MRQYSTDSPDRLAAVRRLAAIAAVSIAMVIAGCSGPSAANNQLRKDNQDLRDQVAQLERRHAADQASLAAANSGGVEVLTAARTQTLFTAAQLKILGPSGGDRSIADLTYDDRLKVYAVPIDMYGDAIKAAGSFHVQAFDLAEKGDQAVGDWTFPLADAQKCWYGKYLLYNYVLDCPWQKPPRHGELTIKVTFVDALTQRELVAQTVVHVTPPAEAAPAPMPDTQPSKVP